MHLVLIVIIYSVIHKAMRLQELIRIVKTSMGVKMSKGWVIEFQKGTMMPYVQEEQIYVYQDLMIMHCLVTWLS